MRLVISKILVQYIILVDSRFDHFQCSETISFHAAWTIFGPVPMKLFVYQCFSFQMPLLTESSRHLTFFYDFFFIRSKLPCLPSVTQRTLFSYKKKAIVVHFTHEQTEGSKGNILRINPKRSYELSVPSPHVCKSRCK